MFITLQAHQYDDNADLMQQMFRLRKRVFADELGWAVPVIGDIERDQYDYLDPVYLIWCSDDRKRLYASLRLMPTTGPTLLHDVFRKTFPGDVDLRAPNIWEATRMCCDRGAIEEDHPDIDPMRAMSLMVCMICEVAVRHGIDTVISNYEPHVARIYRKAGAVFEEIGRADGYGKRPVCCGVFEATPAVLAAMYEKLGLESSLMAPVKRPKVRTPIEVAERRIEVERAQVRGLIETASVNAPVRRPRLPDSIMRLLETSAPEDALDGVSNKGLRDGPTVERAPDRLLSRPGKVHETAEVRGS